MRVLTVKKIGLIIGVMAIFLAIPVSTTFAQMTLKGNPVIECTKAELIMPQEKIANNEYATYADIVFDLKVTLRALKHKATEIRATLRFKDEASIIEDVVMGEENNPIICQKHSQWDKIGIKEEKESTMPFEIKGFHHLPEKIEFEMDITYRNPNDEELYSTTLSIVPGIPDTVIDIISVTNPPDAYKGDNVPIDITVKNDGSEVAVGLKIGITIKSIGVPGALTSPYENTGGAVELHSTDWVIELSFPYDYILPQEQITETYYIPPCGYSNGAMNLGLWEIIRVEACFYNSPSVVKSKSGGNLNIIDPEFNVNKKLQSNGPHALFIYYLWNSGGSGGNWDGDNPKYYFTNGYGNCLAGLWRFNTYDSNIPVLINPIIAYDDMDWSIPWSYHDTSDLKTHGLTTIANHLNNGHWYSLSTKSHRKNCGFDVALLAAGRRGSAAGIATENVALVCKWRYGMPLGNDWRDNIDGTVQHELSHLFGCKDVVKGHPEISCIMAYYTLYIPYLGGYYQVTHIHEHDVLWSINWPTNNWCTDTGTDSCNYQFTQNWNRYYTIAT